MRKASGVNRFKMPAIGTARLVRASVMILLTVAVACSASRARVSDLNGDGVTRIACLGDSNTDTRPQITGRISWCDTLGDLVAGNGWSTINGAAAGARVVDIGSLHLATALTRDPDIVVMAYGTNDLGVNSVATIVAKYAALKQQLEAGGRSAMIALTPPTLPGTMINGVAFNGVVTQLNEAILAAFPSQTVIDFYTPMLLPNGSINGALYDDSIHMNTAGQNARAASAYGHMTIWD